jgi:glycosyltransferase involved in cell wall biosynthesis
MQQNVVKISIVTCTWNSEPYLAETIASVQAQDYANIEFVFVDGGSTDGTLQRITTLPRPVTVLHDVKGGISRAMNEGWRAATGDIVAYLHSDDYYLSPTVLSRVARAFSHTTGWGFGRIVRDIEGQQIQENFVAPKYSRKRLLRGNFIPHPATFVRREWLRQVGGFNESLQYAMDYDLWLKLSRLGEPVVLNGPLAAFREHDRSLSTRNKIAAMEEDYFVRRQHEGFNPLTRLENLARFYVRRNRLVQATRHKAPESQFE